MSMDLSNVADDEYFSNTTAATRAFTYAEVIVSPPRHAAGEYKNQITNNDQNSDEDTRAAIFEITTTARTETELEHARQIIANQQAEIQKLKETQRESTKFLRRNVHQTT
jgi:hypothetical protein